MKKPIRITDEELCCLISKRERQGAELLFDNYAMFLKLAIIRIVKDKNIADQLLEKTFIRIWAAINDYNPADMPFYTWIINMARDEALSFQSK